MNATQLAALTDKPDLVEGTHIQFRVTGIEKLSWSIWTKRQGFLGNVVWHDKWRCYEFMPDYGTGYEHVCLREIAAFCEAMTKIRKGKV